MKKDESEKEPKLSFYQERVEGKSVRCRLCPHNCLIQDGKYGICGTRVNSEGFLYSVSFGNPCSVSIDPIEKKPLFHFFPGESIFSLATAGCNFRCLNCQNWEISQSSPSEINHYNLSPEDVVEKAIDSHTKLIAFTYTEPTVFYEYMFEIAQKACEKGMKTVLISNGYINQQPLLDLIPYLDAANIDLKCFDDAMYHELTGGHLQSVLDTLKILKKSNVWLEITTLLIPTYNDKPEQIQSMCNWLVENGFDDTPLHFSRFFPAYKLTHISITPEKTLIQAKNIAEKTGMKFVYIGNNPQLRSENTLCPNCKRTIVVWDGYVVVKNDILAGKCKFCNETISGVWE